MSLKKELTNMEDIDTAYEMLNEKYGFIFDKKKSIKKKDSINSPYFYPDNIEFILKWIMIILTACSLIVGYVGKDIKVSKDIMISFSIIVLLCVWLYIFCEKKANGE